MRYEVEWPSPRRILAKLDLQIVIPGHPLILPEPETVYRPVIDGSYDISDILAAIIVRTRDGVRRLHGSDSKLDRRNGETLIDKDLRSCGMIDCHQAEIVVVVDLP